MFTSHLLVAVSADVVLRETYFGLGGRGLARVEE
jgi:hypothetical protein